MLTSPKLAPRSFLAHDAMTNHEIHTVPLWQVVLRWILFLPASAVGYIVAHTLFFHLSSWNLGLLSHIPNALPDDVIKFLQSSLPLICAGGAGGVSLIVIGAAVAPRFRTAVSMALLILNTCLFSLYAGSYFLGLLAEERPLAAVVSEYVGAVAGIVATFSLVIRRVGWEADAPISRLWRREISVV